MPDTSKGDGLLLVVSGLSGAGKTSLCSRLCREVRDLALSVSYTTRSPRSEETNGIDYHFVSEEEFERMRDAGGFYEWARVYGSFYGTARKPVEQAWEAGSDVVLQIDIEGAKQVGANSGAAVFVFVLPPDMKELEKRLRDRGEETEASLTGRLAAAPAEIEAVGFFDYVVVNDVLETALDELRAIVTAERLRTSRSRAPILSAFKENSG